MKFLVINGPNLNMLGQREPGIYGNLSYDELCRYIKREADNMGAEVELYQSNVEGEIINAIHGAKGKFDAVVINPGAYTHYSYAIFDAITAIGLPAVEVHISNIYKREEFRHKSVIAPACEGQISGLGLYGYILALNYLIHNEQKKESL